MMRVCEIASDVMQIVLVYVPSGQKADFLKTNSQSKKLRTTIYYIGKSSMANSLLEQPTVHGVAASGGVVLLHHC
jgi:hypothetical protein